MCACSRVRTCMRANFFELNVRHMQLLHNQEHNQKNQILLSVHILESIHSHTLSHKTHIRLVVQSGSTARDNGTISSSLPGAAAR